MATRLTARAKAAQKGSPDVLPLECVSAPHRMNLTSVGQMENILSSVAGLKIMSNLRTVCF